jgi:hypothetical protein
MRGGWLETLHLVRGSAILYPLHRLYFSDDLPQRTSGCASRGVCIHIVNNIAVRSRYQALISTVNSLIGSLAESSTEASRRNVRRTKDPFRKLGKQVHVRANYAVA